MGDGERAAQVDAQHEVPQARVGLDEEGEEIGAGVVDEHVDRAERLADLGDRGGDGLHVGDVHAHGVPFQLGGNGAGALLVEVGDRHARTFGGKAPSSGGTDPRGRAGDESDLSL